MIRILKELKQKDRWMALICLILVAGQVWLDLRLPEFMKDVTILISTGSEVLSEYFIAGAKMLGLAFVSALLSIVVGYFASLIAADFSFAVREKVFSKVMEFGPGEINNFSTASLITRTTNDITQIQFVIAMGLQVMIKAPIMAVWAVIKIVGKSYELSIMTAGAVIIIIAAMIILLKIVMPKFKIVQKQIDDVNRVTRENLTGIRVIRAFNAEGYQEEKFEGASGALMKTQLFTQRALAFLFPVMVLVQSTLSLGIYYVGAQLINNIEVPLTGSFAEMISAIGTRAEMLGDVVTFNSYALYVIMSFVLLLAIIMILPRAQVSADRINEVLTAGIKVTEGQLSGGSGESGTIEFRNVSFRYPDASEDCLKHISFTAHRGETVAFIGATGSGKSTLVSLAVRLYDTTEGEVLVDGINIRDYDFSTLYSKVGFIPQKAVLFSGSIRENITFGNSGHDVTDDDIRSAAAISQAMEFIESSEEGLDKQIAQGGTNVSGGQKQRLAIARAIARKPEILIFDDSFSALDYKTDRLLRREISEKLPDVTRLIVAQRIGTIRNADRIIVLDQGETVGIGTHDELMNNCPVYREIALSQLSQAELA